MRMGSKMRGPKSGRKGGIIEKPEGGGMEDEKKSGGMKTAALL